MRPSTDSSSATILYVTAEPARAEEVREGLSELAGFDVLTASNSADALGLLAETPRVACVLSDAPLPDSDVFEFLEAVRSIDPARPFVLYAIEPSTALVERAIAANVAGYLERSAGTDQTHELAITLTTAIDADRTQNALRERLKELEGIQQVSRLLETTDRPLEEVLAAVVKLVPTSFQRPETTESRLTVGRRSVETERFDVGGDSLSARAVATDGTEILLEAVALETDQQREESLFLAEERDLLETIVRLLRVHLERRTYVEALEESERRFRQVSENVTEAVWLTDVARTELLYVNPAYEEIWGRSRDSLYRDPSSFLEAIVPEDRERVERAIAAQPDGDYDSRYRIVGRNGEVRWIHDRAYPVMDEAGERYRIVRLAEDVTERQERERQLALLDRVLRHNLRNEMNVALGYATLLSEAGDGPVTEYATEISAVCERLLDLADKQRRVAALLSEPRTRERQDLTETLTRVVDEARTSYPEATITLSVHDLESATLTPHVEFALTELIDNAVSHSDREIPSVEVTATLEASGIVIRVADDGPGIPPEERTALTDVEDALNHGSGMGLWYVHWIVTNAGGTLSFEANVPRGSVVAMAFTTPAER